MSELFDVTAYVRPPVLKVAGAVGLATALLHAIPRDAPPPVRAAAKKLRARAAALQEAWRGAERVSRAEDPRPADQAIDNAWGALYARLEAYASLDRERVPRAARAAELLTALFPDGLSFLKLPYAEEWSESKKRLDRVASDALDKDLDALAGKEFLEEVRAAHERYGKAIGITAPRAAVDAPASLVEPLREVSRAIAAYAVQVVAAAQQSDDEATTSGLLRALRPIDDHRADGARRSKSKSGSAEGPDVVLPEVPPME